MVSAPPLVVRCGAFGDVVMVTTLLRLLAARYGRPVDYVGSGAWTPPLLRNEPALGHLQLLTSRTTPYWLCRSQWALVRWLRARGRGPVYLADTQAAMRALLLRGGVRDEDIVTRMPGESDIDGVPQLWPDRWLALGQRNPAHAWPVREDVDASAFRLPQLVVDDAARREFTQWRDARGLRGPLVLFQAGNKRTHKRGTFASREHPKYWPPGHWAAVARAILQELPQAQILLCGSPSEKAVVEEIRKACGDEARVHNFADELPIPRLLALLEQAHSLVSVDTGPAHAAAALECPSVVLFGAASPKQWTPIGKGAIVTLGGERGEDSLVRDIPVAAVIEAWRNLAPRPA